MARFRTIQQRFTQGEIDPLMIGRSDIDQYYGCGSELRNVFTLPQGGFKRRPGLEYIDRIPGVLSQETGTITAPNGGTTTNLSDNNTGTLFTTTTNIGVLNPYVVAQWDFTTAKNLALVYINGASLSAGTSDQFVMQVSNNGTTWTTKDIPLSLSTTAKDFSRRLFGSYRYLRLARIGATSLTATFSVKDILVFSESGVSETKRLDFRFNRDQTYKMIFSDKNLAIYQGIVPLIDIYLPDYTQDKLAEIDTVQSRDTMVLFHPDVQTKLLQRVGGNDVWQVSLVPWTNIPWAPLGQRVYSTPAGLFDPNLTGAVPRGRTVTVTLGSAVASAAWVGQYINYITTKGGRLQVKAFNSTTSITAVVVEELSDGNSVASGGWQLESGYEQIWTTTRGWPRHGAFFQGRLWVDGGRSRPNAAYGSNVNDYYNFDFGGALDDQAIGPIGDADMNDIQAFYPGRNLMMFTTDAEYILPQPFGDPLTPTNVVLARQSALGAAAFPPQEAEGGVMYIQNGGKSVQEFIYDDAQSAFTNNFLSLLSSHLVNDPKDFALRKATNTEEGAYLMLVLPDGSLTIANILRNQGITAFTKSTTDGSFKNCGADVEDMYFVIERNINGQPVRYLERFNSLHYTDCSTQITVDTPDDTFVGLDWLEGETVSVLADSSLMENKTVTAGTIVVERDVQTVVEVGLNFEWRAKDLPVENTTIGGTVLGNRMNVSEITLRLSETADILVNGKRLSFRGFGPSGSGSPLDQMPPRFTGIKTMKGWRGWDDTAQVTLSGDKPLPATVLVLSKRVNV